MVVTLECMPEMKKKLAKKGVKGRVVSLLELLAVLTKRLGSIITQFLCPQACVHARWI